MCVRCAQVLLTSQSQLQEVEAENSRLQLRLKQLNEEYRSRLAQYIKDVAVGTPSPRGSPKLGGSLHAGCLRLAGCCCFPSSLGCRAEKAVGLGEPHARSWKGAPCPRLGLGEEMPLPPLSSPRFPLWPHKTVCEFLLGDFSWSDYLD